MSQHEAFNRVRASDVAGGLALLATVVALAVAVGYTVVTIYKVVKGWRKPEDGNGAASRGEETADNDAERKQELVYARKVHLKSEAIRLNGAGLLTRSEAHSAIRLIDNGGLTNIKQLSPVALNQLVSAESMDGGPSGP